MRGNKERLTIHGHSKNGSDHNLMHVLIEHVNKMGIVRWCLFFWLFAESNLVLEFKLFVFLLFHDLV